MALNRLSALSSSLDESFTDVDVQNFKGQMTKVQDLIEEYNSKMLDRTLRSEDLDNMNKEMRKLTAFEERVTYEKMRVSYVSYKTASLKLVQDSYRLCNWFLEKQFNEVDNVFDVDSFVEKIIEACAGKVNSLNHINILFKGAFKNANDFDLNFFGNFQSNNFNDCNELTQSKKEYKRSQKRQLEELVVPVETENVVGDNELQKSLKRVLNSLKAAVSNNKKKPIPFFKFAIDPFSLTYTVENLFNLASLVKDGIVEIEKAPGDNSDMFLTVTVAKTKNDDNIKNIRASFFKINEELWKFYIKKYNITERMIDQDE